MTYLLSYTCVLFLPSMHERYGFLYEVLAIVLAVMIPRMIPMCMGLICISLTTYGSYLFGTEKNLPALSWLNLVIYVLSILLLGKEMEINTKKEEPDIDSTIN